MEDKIFLSTLLYKNIVEKSDNRRHLAYKALGPMMGTLENGVFINTHDRQYTSIEKTTTNMDDSIRYAYYNLISLKEAKKKYNTTNVEETVSKFNEDHKKDSFYVIDIDNAEPLIIKYDADKCKRVYDSDVARPIV